MINELLETRLFELAGFVLLNSLWLGGILGLIYWLVWKFAKHYSSSFRYNLLLSFLLIFAASNFYFLYDAFPENRMPNTTGYLNSLPVSDAQELSQAFHPHGKVNILAVLKSSIKYINQYRSYIGFFWLTGFIVLSIRFLGGFFYLNTIKNNGIKPFDQKYKYLLEDLIKKTGSKQNVSLMESSKIDSPLTIGFWSPIILLPLGMMATIPPAQLEAILLHELYHIRNRDYLINIFQSIICIIFFYHPLVWWLSKQIDEEREHICDDATVAFSGNPMALARALTFLQEHQLHLNNHLAMSLSGNKSKFNNRIYRLFNHRKQVSFKVAGLFSLAIVLMMATAFTFIHVRKTSAESNLRTKQIPDLKGNMFQDFEKKGDTRIILSALNFKIIAKEGKLQIVKKEGTLSDPLLVVDDRLVELNNIETVDPDDIASISVHKSEKVSEGVIAIHTNEFRDIRFRGSVKSATEKRNYPEPDPERPKSLYIYMIEGKEVTEEEFNKIEYFIGSFEGIGVEEALIRFGMKGKNGVFISNKRIY